MAVWSNTALSDIKNQFGRLDAEFYKPDFLKTDRMLSTFNNVKLHKISSKIDVGHVGPMVKHYSENGVILLQTQNVREFFLDLNHLIKIDTKFHNQLLKSQIHKWDLLIARSGSFGATVIYLGDEVINSADIIIVSIKKDPTIDPLYVLTFMNTVYGSSQLIRFSSGGLQGHVNLKILEHLRIPILKPHDQKEIADLVLRAYNMLNDSYRDYNKAKQIFETELELNTPPLKSPPGFTSKFSETMSAGRIDSDYFQPQYIAAQAAIRSYDGGYESLLNYTDALRPNIDPVKTPNKIFNYIELSNINPSLGIVEGFQPNTGIDLPSRAKRQVQTGDVIASAVVGSVDKAALISKKEDGFLASTGFFHFRAKTVFPEYLLILVRSQCVRMQFQQQSTGGILSAVPDRYLKTNNCT